MTSQRMALSVARVLLLGCLGRSGQQSGAASHWVGIWSTANTWRAPAAGVPSAGPPLVPSPTPAATTPPAVQFSGQTLRQVVHTTFGGDRLRVVFSNAF